MLQKLIEQAQQLHKDAEEEADAAITQLEDFISQEEILVCVLPFISNDYVYLFIESCHSCRFVSYHT